MLRILDDLLGFTDLDKFSVIADGDAPGVFCHQIYIVAEEQYGGSGRAQRG
jgi:hypothetical protein